MPYINILGKRTYYHQGCDFQAGLSTILFVHGAGGTGENWLHQLAGIQGYNLIALDLPGHGLSEGSASDNIIVYRDFVWYFAQALKLGPFIMAGHSMGGAIALELALEFSEGIKGLIIVGSGAKLRVNQSILEALSRGIHPIKSVKYFYSNRTSTEIIEQAIIHMKNVPIEVYQADFKACNEFNIMDRIQNIINPALVICGEEDQMTPLKYSDYLCKALPHSTMSIVTDAGHLAMLEQPDQVNQAIISFLTQVNLLT